VNDVFVVIATHGRGPLLARTLATVAECRRPNGFRGVIVVENGGRGDAERVVAAAPAALAAQYLFEPIGNKCRALNAALARIDTGLVVFLDDDVRAEAWVLEAYARAAEGAGRNDFFGGPVEPDYEAPPPEWLTEFLPPSARGWRPPDDAVALNAKPFFLGFNWAAFADGLRAVGGFDERLGPGSDIGIGDESDVQRRLAAAGGRAMSVPDALVHHWVPRARCSPEWALERAYRSGVRTGWLRPAPAGPTVAGYPLKLVTRLAAQWVRRNLPWRGAGPGERFAAHASFQRQRGVLRGMLLRRRDLAANRAPQPWPRSTSTRA
jgi:GT2 family glycosyltransferase